MYKKTAFALVLGLCFANFLNAQDENLINPIPAKGQIGDDTTTIVYDPAQGSWWLEHPETLAPLTTIEITSTEDFFSGDPPNWIEGNFDIYNPKKAFKLEPAGFGTLSAGGAKTGMSAEVLSQILTVTGSFLPEGPIEQIDLMVVPEPTSFSAIFLVIVGFGVILRRIQTRH